MRYDEGADLDTSEVQDMRGGGGGFGGFGGRGVVFGGGGLGLVGVVNYVLVQVMGGGSGGTGTGVGGFPGVSPGQSADGSQLAQDCRTGKDANASVQCAVVADIDSIQGYWSQVLGSRYTETDTRFFSGSTQTGCGAASSGTGPF